MMKLSIFQNDVFSHYKNNSQIARVLSEDWCASEMYCPSCLNEKIDKFENNRKVSDFFCKNCNNEFQLKCSSKKFGKKVVDGAYNTMIEFIYANSTPNFFLMHYSKDEWMIKNLFLIPRFFVSASIIEKRNPLKDTARRAGWVGCNFLLNRIPDDGRIAIVKNEKIVDMTKVHKIWERMFFLNQKHPRLRGWTSDVLKCIQDLGKDEFSLKDAYQKKDYLSELHPDNLHIEAKIRQQLQILRDNGIVEFMSKGRYKLK